MNGRGGRQSQTVLHHEEAVAGGLVAIEGDADKVARLFTLLDDFVLMFEVVEPKRA